MTTEWLGADGSATLTSAQALAAATTPRIDVTIGSSGGFVPLRPCGPWVKTGQIQNGRSERFMNVYSVGSNAKPWVTQEVGSSHTLGIAVKAPGAPWTLSGSNTRSTSSSLTTHRGYIGGMRNQVNYREYKRTCPSPLRYWYQWKPYSVHSLNSGFTAYAGVPAWNYRANCGEQRYRVGDFTKSEGSNATFSNGVNLTVLDVSAKATFSSNTKLRFDFSGAGAYMCGSTSQGPVSSPQAGAYYTFRN